MPEGGREAGAASCTRTGLLIILMSGLCLTLLEPLEIAYSLGPLSKYIAKRVNLSAQLDEVQHNTCITSLGLDTMSLKALGKSHCFANAQQGSNSPLQVIEALKVVNNHQDLEAARRPHFMSDFSIYRWKLRVNTEINGGVNYENITFRQAKALSDFEYPDMSRYEQLFLKYNFLTPMWIPLSVRLSHAVSLLLLALFFTLAYFWLMFTEAIESGESWQKGTIFSALKRNRFSRSLLFLFVALPPTVSAILLAEYYRVADALQVVYKKSVFLDASLFLGILFMACVIWRSAKADWTQPPFNSRPRFLA